MDPNAPGQGPDMQTPPPPPPYGAPQDPYGTPPAWGTPPPGTPAGPPPAWGTPPPGAPPAWGIPTVAPQGGGSKLRGIIVGIVVLVVVGAIVGAVALLGSTSGKVMFSKTAYAMGTNTCKFDNAVTDVSSTDSFYLIANLKDDIKSADNITITITKDGAQFFTNTIPASKDFNCYVEDGSIGPLDPGTYVFQITKDGKVEAEGTLTVK